MPLSFESMPKARAPSPVFSPRWEPEAPSPALASCAARAATGHQATDSGKAEVPAKGAGKAAAGSRETEGAGGGGRGQGGQVGSKARGGPADQAVRTSKRSHSRRRRKRPRRGWGRPSPSSGLRATRASRRPGPTPPQSRRPFLAALTSATVASRSAPRSVTGACRRARATAAREGSRRLAGRHPRRPVYAREPGEPGQRPGSEASDTERTAHAGAAGPAPPAGQEESGHRVGFLPRQAREAQAPP